MIIKGEGRFELHVKELQRNSYNGKILQNFQRTSFYQEVSSCFLFDSLPEGIEVVI